MAHNTQQAEFRLPASVARVADVSRLAYELESLDNYLREASVRQTGSAMTLPKMSNELQDIASKNNLNLLEESHRDYLQKYFNWLREHAPQVHLSFSTVPSQQFITKIAGWFRKNISPVMLLRIGLQPTIGVGCSLRTTNKIFDLSLKQRFEKQKELLVQQLANSTMPVKQTEASPVEVPAQ